MGQDLTQNSYDVVIIGGAMIGASIAWFLTRDPAFDGRVLVVERDPSYEFASSSHTNSCMRQQFSNPINIRISQFAAEYVKNFRAFMGDDPRVPDVALRSFGYMYLADNPAFAAHLKEMQAIQQAHGAGTRYMTRDAIAAAYPFYQLDDIIGANHNLVDEGYFEGSTLFDWWKRASAEQGADYIADEVVALRKSPEGRRITAVRLKSGAEIACGTVINASGPRAARTAAMAWITLPVEPRKRYTFIFDAETPLDRDLPLTIDPTGVHMRSDGRYYLAGCPPDLDPAVDFDDFTEDHRIWEDKAWPAIAARVPQFEAIKLINSWVGHYAFNTLDQNAILGPHTEIANFMFANGFSGHGFQQSPAMGRGMAELIIHGEFRALDLSEFGFDRIAAARPFLEMAVI